jgi:MFS family permease
MGTAFKNKWWIVFGATISTMVAQGPVILYTLGLFIKPLNQDFGWDRASISAAGGLAAISSAIATPFVGSLIDRWGVRAVLLPIVVLCASSVALIALAPNSLVVFMLLFALTGALGLGQGPLGYAKCVSAWFDDRRGLALGITMSGVGLGAALVPQYTQFLIGNFGWRTAYAGLGLLTLIIAFPAVALFIREPIKTKSTAGAVQAQALASEGRLPDLEVREAIRGRRFWLIACALLLVSTVTQGMVVHTIPLLTDKGYSPETAAALMIAIGLSTMTGRLLSGYLVDRIFAPFVAAFFFLLPCLGIYLLGSTISPVAGIISLGLASGTEIDMIGFPIFRNETLRSVVRLSVCQLRRRLGHRALRDGARIRAVAFLRTRPLDIWRVYAARKRPDPLPRSLSLPGRTNDTDSRQASHRCPCDLAHATSAVCGYFLQ